MNRVEWSNASTRRVPFNDLSVQWRQIASEVREDVESIFTTSAFCLGPFVDAFETDVAKYLNVRHAIAVNSGTSALHVAALAAGLGPGNQIIVPAHTFIATLWGILYAGATPVLCDVEPDTGNIDLAAAEQLMTPAVKAIIPVHLYGQPADMANVMNFAGRHRITVIEDAAQSIGALHQGRHLGTIGAIGCYSFYPGKNLGGAGEAGLVVTNDGQLAARMRALRNHGQSQRYIHEEIGFNYRMDGLQGAVLRRKLPHLVEWTKARKMLADRYSQRLEGLPLKLPVVRHGDHVWHLYVVRAADRDRLRVCLAERGVETGLHYPVPLHKQPCLRDLPSAQLSFPVADNWADQCLSLPLYTGMTLDDVDYVSDAVRASY